MVLQQLAFQQQQSQLYAAQIAGEGFGARLGQKRDLDGDDGGFESFLMDMKKRKVEPVYDSNMMNRLNGLVPTAIGNGFPPLPSLLSQTAPMYQQQQPQIHNYQTMPQMPNNHSQHHAPAPTGLPEIRTEADLAMFNQFMISLGRDAMGQTNYNVPAMSHEASYDSGSASTSSDSPLSDQSPIEDLFNAEELASLGLAGMPGVPIPTINAPDQSSDMSNSLTSNSSVSFGNLYPSLDNLHLSRARTHSVPELHDANKRTIANLPRNNSIAVGRQEYNNPAFMANPYSDLNSFAQVDTSGYSFDTLAKSRSPIQPPTMAPRDFLKKTYRHVAPLGAAMSSRLHESAERTDITDEHETSEPEEMTTPKISVRSLLLSDDQADPAFKLPAIHHAPGGSNQPLPSLNEVAAISSPRQAPAKRHTEDDITRGVKRLELDDASRPSSAAGREKEMRRRHAQMSRGWLVAVNLEWRRKKLEEIHREEVGRLGLEIGEIPEEDEEEEMRSGSEDDDDESLNGDDEVVSRGGFGGVDFRGSASRMREIVGILS